jgi:hypothetical protein
VKVFLSWSGPRSKAVAELLNDWLRCVLQACKPWISSRDIDRGALWFTEISGQLSDTGIGIVCLTADNKNKPWILFEAGALAKGLSHARVCTLLIDLKPSEIEDPLAQFNHTFPERESMWGLVRTLNGSLQNQSIDERVLVNVFATYWPQFESEFKKIVKTVALEEEPKKRTEQSLLGEILDNTRGLNSRVRQLEARIEDAAAIATRSMHERVMSNIAQHAILSDYEKERADVFSKIVSKERAVDGRERLRRLREQLAGVDRPDSGSKEA